MSITTCLQGLKHLHHPPIQVQLAHTHVAHAVGALPLASALSHLQEGVQVKGSYTLDPGKPAA